MKFGEFEHTCTKRVWFIEFDLSLFHMTKRLVLAEDCEMTEDWLVNPSTSLFVICD